MNEPNVICNCGKRMTRHAMYTDGELHYILASCFQCNLNINIHFDDELPTRLEVSD